MPGLSAQRFRKQHNENRINAERVNNKLQTRSPDALQRAEPLLTPLQLRPPLLDLGPEVRLVGAQPLEHPVRPQDVLLHRLDRLPHRTLDGVHVHVARDRSLPGILGRKEEGFLGFLEFWRKRTRKKVEQNVSSSLHCLLDGVQVHVARYCSRASILEKKEEGF